MTPPRQGAVFLDRDGVINKSPGKKRYIMEPEEFKFLPGVLPALRRLKKTGRRILLVSNQAGVGRGLFTQNQLKEVTRKMLEGVREHGGRINAVYYCTHTPEQRCRCRKPRTGLLRKAARRWTINLKKSVVVGDNGTDIEMGQSAGCKTVLVLTGVTTKTAARKMARPPDFIAKNLPGAATWILKHKELFK